MIIESIRLTRISGMPYSLDITLKLGRQGQHTLFGPYLPEALNLTENQVEGILTDVAGLNVPMAGLDGVLGLDGETYTLTIISGFQEASFQWWCEPPKGWEALGRIADKMERLSCKG